MRDIMRDVFLEGLVMCQIPLLERTRGYKWLEGERRREKAQNHQNRCIRGLAGGRVHKSALKCMAVWSIFEKTSKGTKLIIV